MVKAVQERINNFINFLKQHFEVIICSEFKIVPEGEKSPCGKRYFDIVDYSHEMVLKKMEEEPRLWDEQRKAMERLAENLDLKRH